MAYESIEDPLLEREVVKPSAKRWGLVGVAATLMLVGAAAMTGAKVLPRAVPIGSDVSRSVDGVASDGFGSVSPDGASSAGDRWYAYRGEAQRGLWGKAKSLFKKAKEKVQDTWDDVKENVKDKAEDVRDQASDAMNSVRDKASNMMDSFRGSDMMQGAQDMMDNMMASVQAKMDQINDSPSIEKAKSIVEDLRLQGADAMQSAMERVTALRGDSKKFMQDALNQAREHDVMQSMMEKFNDLKEQGSQMGNMIKDQSQKFMHDAMDVIQGSPTLRNARTIVDDLKKKGEQGMEEAMVLMECLQGDARSAMEKAIENVKGAEWVEQARSKVLEMKQKGDEMMAKSKNFMQSAMEKIKSHPTMDQITDIANELQGHAENGKREAMVMMSQLTGDTKKMMEDALKKVNGSKWVQNAMDQFEEAKFKTGGMMADMMNQMKHLALMSGRMNQGMGMMQNAFDEMMERVRSMSDDEYEEYRHENLEQDESGCQEAENQSLIWLDRHHVSCGDEPINSLHFSQDGCGGKDRQWNYECLKMDYEQGGPDHHDHNTQCDNANNKGSHDNALLWNLKEFELDCGEGRVMSEFKVTHDGCDWNRTQKGKFWYRCVDVAPEDPQVEVRQTGCDWVDYAHQLDRFPMSCDVGYGIGGWKMITDNNDECPWWKYKFEYTCVQAW